VFLKEIERALKVASVPGRDEDTAEWRENIVSRSAIMEQLLDKVKLVSRSNSSILLRGQSGTGKELLAKALHMASERYDKPFIPVNCSAIPEALLESELFGHMPVCSGLQTKVPYFLMKSVTCQFSCRLSCYGFFRTVR